MHGRRLGMSNHLGEIVKKIGEAYREQIQDGARNYLEVDIGQQAERLGFAEEKDKYRHVRAVVPIKEAVAGMKVRIDGRTFVNYAKFNSGVAVPEYVAKDTGLPYEAYQANDSMILNFA
jgi:hypothetical protein